MNIFSPGFIRNAEKIIAVIAVAAIVAAKILHLPAANIFMVVSLCALALVYARGLPDVLGENKEQQNFGLNTATGVLLSVACVGILFRLQYWPAGKNMVGLAAIGLPVLIGAVFYFKGKEARDLSSYFNRLLLRQAVFGALAIALYVASNKDLLTLQYPNDPEIVRIKSNHFDHPENEAYTKEYMEYVEAQRYKQQ